MQVGEYLEHNEIPRVVGTSHIGNLISIIKERENEKRWNWNQKSYATRSRVRIIKLVQKVIYPKNMKEIVIACHGFAGDKESSAILALANELDKEKK